MKILHVTAMYPGEEHPWLGAFVKSLVVSLVKEGIECNVLFMDTKTSKLNYLRGILQLNRKIFSEKFDLIHAHYLYAGIVARCQTKIPVVIDFHGSDIMTDRLRKISNLVAPYFDGIIVKSERMAERLKVKNVDIIPCSVDLNSFPFVDKIEARQRLNLHRNKIYLLFVGDKRRPEKQFWLAERANERLIKQFKIDTELLAISNVAHEEMFWYYNACDCLILTSKYEGSPVAIKEALACNLPIVSVDVGDVRERLTYVKNCYVSPHDPDEITLHLKKALVRNTRSNGREIVSEFSEERIARKVINVYYKILNG